MQATKSLVIAVFLQAMKDYSNPKYQDDVRLFLNSDRFELFLDVIRDENTPLPDSKRVKEVIHSFNFSTVRKGYHTRRNRDGKMAA